MRLILTDEFNVPTKDETPASTHLIKKAYQLRRDLAAVNPEPGSVDIALEGRKNELLPELDFAGAVESAGHAGNRKYLVGLVELVPETENYCTRNSTLLDIVPARVTT